MRPWFIMALLLIPGVFAFSVSPASNDFINPESASYQLRIINKHNEDISLRLILDGDLKEFISLSREQVRLQPGISDVRVNVIVSVPLGTLPGTYEGGIIIEQVMPQTSGDTIAAVPAVRHRVEVVVPNNGKFVRARIGSSASSAGSPASISIGLENVGTENIDEVSARIEIRGPTNSLIDTLETASISLPLGSSKSVTSSWVPPATGLYSVRSIINYDGLSTSIEKVIEVGSLDISVGDIVFGEFILGDIVRLDIPISSEWNEPLPGVFAKFKIVKDGVVVDEFTSLRTDLAPLGSGDVTGYWNTAGLSPGSYDIEADIFFAGQKKSVSSSIFASVDSVELVEKESFDWVQLVLLILFFLLITLWFIKRFINKRY